MPSEPATGQDQRLHPLSVLFSLAVLARTLVLPVLFLFLTGRSDSGSRDWSDWQVWIPSRSDSGPENWWDWQVWMPLLLIPYAAYAVARYLSFRYRYEASEMVIRTGILFRNERHVPYTRIQNVDAVQNVFHRLLGVVEVRVETGGGNEPEARMSVLPVAAYEEMRRRVFLEKGAEKGDTETPVGPATVPVSGGRTLLAPPLRELALLGVVQNRGGVLFAALAGGLWNLLELANFPFIERFFGEEITWRSIARTIFSSGEALVERAALALLAGAFLLLFLCLVSIVWTLVRLYGFRLTADGEDLRTEYGLFTRVTATVPLRRIQTLTIREGLLFRLFGRAAVRVDTAGGGSEQEGEGETRQREWLAPILRREEVPELLRQVLPELGIADMAEIDWQPPHPRAFSREIKAPLLIAALVSLASALLLQWWAFALLVVLAAWAFVSARQTVRHLGWAVTDEVVLFRSGWLRREITVARFAKIQAVALHESPFDRRTAMARVQVDTAGVGSASHRVDIPYLARETALRLHDLLAARAARTAFRW